MNYGATPNRVVSTLPPFTAVSRTMIALGKANGNPDEARMLAAGLIDTPQVEATFKAYTSKGSVPAGSTTESTWAEPLTRYGIAQEALTYQRGVSILGAIEGRLRRVPLQMRVPRQTGSGSGGAWVQEGAPAPVVSYAFDQLMLEAHKAMLLTVLSKELLQFAPGTEKTVREAVLGSHAEYVDHQFLDPTVTATSAHPASITAGATAVTSTGATAAQMTADFGALVAAITTGGRSLVWIMRPTTAARIALSLGAAAADLPRTLFGIPVILNANSPAQVTLVDAAEIAYGDDGGIEIGVSRQASIEMEDEPTNESLEVGSPAGLTHTSMVSLFQTNSVCFKVIRWLSWERVRSGSVAYMTVSY